MATKSTKPILAELSSETDAERSAFALEVMPSRDEVLTVHGGGDLALYERLLRDDQVHSVFQSRRASVVALPWKVDPGGNRPIDKDAADFLRDQLTEIGFDRVSHKMLAGLMYGRAHAEILYRADGGRVLVDAIKVRRARRFTFGASGELIMTSPRREVMPERKFWSFVCGADDDDDLHGRGLGHWLYWPVWFKRHGLRFWSLWIEKLAAGTPYGRVPAGTTTADQQAVLEILEAITNGGRVVVPKSVELAILEAARASGQDYGAFVDRMDGAISKVIVSQTMTTDDGSSLSQSQVHLSVQQMVTKSDADLLCESFTRGPATWITDWNFPGAVPPVVYRESEKVDDLEARARRDQSLFAMGWAPSEEYVLETYGTGFERAPTPALAPQGPVFAEPVKSLADAAEDAVSDDGWRRVMGPQIDQLDKLLSDAASLEEVRDRLGELALKAPGELVESLARVMFTAKIAGTVGAKIDDGD